MMKLLLCWSLLFAIIVVDVVVVVMAEDDDDVVSRPSCFEEEQHVPLIEPKIISSNNDTLNGKELVTCTLVSLYS